jgi:hypothetical protein
MRLIDAPVDPVAYLKGDSSGATLRRAEGEEGKLDCFNHYTP